MIPGQTAVKDLMQGAEEMEESGSLYRTIMTGLGFDMRE
jgi:hypothetical protein